MRERSVAWPRAAWLPAMLLLALSGCRDPKQAHADAIKAQEQRVIAQMKAERLVTDQAVDCPNMHVLRDQVGDWIRCGVGLEGDDPQLYQVTVKRVTGDGRHLLHIKPMPLGVDKAELEANTARAVAADSAGHPVASIACPEHLMGAPGASVRCDVLLADGRRFGATATRPGIQGGKQRSLHAGTTTNTAVRYMSVLDLAPEPVAAFVRERWQSDQEAAPEDKHGVQVRCDAFLDATPGAGLHCPMTRAGRVVGQAAVTFRNFDPTRGMPWLDVDFVPHARADS